MTKTNLTELEVKFMSSIPKDNFFEDGYESALWVDIFLDEQFEESSKVLRGVLSSLVKKEFIQINGDSEEGFYFLLKENGIDYLKKNIKWLDDEGYPM